MRLPEPKVGSVIRYAYLWLDEARAGQHEGRKDRPTLVLALSVRRDDGETEVIVLAITHTPPRTRGDAIEIPASACQVLGLDDERAWVVTSEANLFTWPGPDLRTIPGRKPKTVIYGQMPATVLKAVAVSYLANHKRQQRLVRRSS